MEPLEPIKELNELMFALSSVEQLFPPGTYERENVRNVLGGIRSRLHWCIRQIEAAGEGKGNYGA